MFIQNAVSFVVGLVSGFIANYLWDRYKHRKKAKIGLPFVDIAISSDGYYDFNGRIERGTASSQKLFSLQKAVDTEMTSTSASSIREI